MITDFADKLGQPLWDSVRFVGRADLFKTPAGNGSSLFDVVKPKGFPDTNLLLPGALPAGWHYITDEIRCEPLLETTVAMLVGVVIELYIGSKRYLEIPAERAAPRFTLAQLEAGLLLPGMSYGFRINPSLHISDREHFGCQVSAVDDEERSLRVSLHGTLFRPVQ